MLKKLSAVGLVAAVVAGCAVFGPADPLERAFEVCSEFIMHLAKGEDRAAYAQLTDTQQAEMSFESFTLWAESHRREFLNLVEQPDSGIRSIVRQDGELYATVFLDGRTRTWMIRPEGWSWRLEVPVQENPKNT